MIAATLGRLPYRCPKCQDRFRHPHGRCPRCGYAVIVRELRADEMGGAAPGSDAAPVRLSDLEPVADEGRAPLGVPALDRILGGGAPRAYSVLCSGGEGLGKSTLLLEAACRSGLRALYATSEEDSPRIAARARRLDLPLGEVYSFRLSEGESLLRAVGEGGHDLVILDSVQTCGYGGEPPGHQQGSIALVRAVHDWAHRTGGIAFLVCHETKEGDAAGPRALAHAVDAVIGLGWPQKPEEDATEDERCLYVLKNRAGPAPMKARVVLTGQGFEEVET